MTALFEETSDKEKVFAFLAHLTRMSHDIHGHVGKDQIDIDEFDFNPTAVGSSTILKPKKNVRKPIIVQEILATFPVNSTSVVIQLGPRTINVPPTLGVFNPQLRLQLEYEDDRIMTVTPAAICFFGVMGYADDRKADRP